tara:strand:+ start:378 stop:581 length:204 start_codon:yes stop_codon:yes gene_type:complete
MILQNSIENNNINISKSDVLEFIEIRDSGEYNMYNPVVRKMIGLDKREYKYLLNNFDEICDKYGIDV